MYIFNDENNVIGISFQTWLNVHISVQGYVYGV
jgi:hypothetical protein